MKNIKLFKIFQKKIKARDHKEIEQFLKSIMTFYRLQPRELLLSLKVISYHWILQNKKN